MTIQVDAVYQGGILLPKQPLTLPEGSEVRIAIQTNCAATNPLVADPLAEVIGIGDGPIAGDVAKHHDDYLYGRGSE